MFDFARRVQLAVGDTARRATFKVAAGLAGSVAVGFLTAALWSWLATDLQWGATLASLTISGVLLVVMLLLLMVSNTRRHEMPTTDDLKREVDARISLATEAAVSRARAEANRVVELAENRAYSLMDKAGTRATQFAADAEDKLFGTVRSAAKATGLTSSNLTAARTKLHDGTQSLRHASDSNPGSIGKLVGAFAVGVTLAAALNERRTRSETFDHDDII